MLLIEVIHNSNTITLNTKLRSISCKHNPLSKNKKFTMSDSKQLESYVLRGLVKLDQFNKKDIYDMIDEIGNLTDNFGEFRKEILDDLTEAAGLFVDNKAMDFFRSLMDQQKQQQK